MKIYYVVNARIPTEKAHGIQTAKTCESFIEAGHEVTLIVPNRSTDDVSIRDYYGLRVDVPIVRIAGPDWYLKGTAGFVISSVCFMAGYVSYLRRARRNGEDFLLYTVDMDTFSSSALAFVGRPFVTELHGIKPRTPFTNLLIHQAAGVITINRFVAEEIMRTFGLSSERVLIEPNGIDLELFENVPEKREARRQLGIPENELLVLYIGRLYGWKGLSVLGEAAARMQGTMRLRVVGGTKEDYLREGGSELPERLTFEGGVVPTVVPLWLSAADALLVLGTKAQMSSYLYTSPMKVFEYMAVGKPIIASRTPALRAILNEESAWWYEPDDADSLARVAEEAVKGADDTRPIHARVQATHHAWNARAARILAFVDRVVSV